jgi:hypothetical protein
MKLIVDIFAGWDYAYLWLGWGKYWLDGFSIIRPISILRFFLGCGLGIVILFIGGLLKLFGPIYFIAILVFAGYLR